MHEREAPSQTSSSSNLILIPLSHLLPSACFICLICLLAEAFVVTHAGLQWALKTVHLTPPRYWGPVLDPASGFDQLIFGNRRILKAQQVWHFRCTSCLKDRVVDMYSHIYLSFMSYFWWAVVTLNSFVFFLSGKTIAGGAIWAEPGAPDSLARMPLFWLCFCDKSDKHVLISFFLFRLWHSEGTLKFD